MRAMAVAVMAVALGAGPALAGADLLHCHHPLAALPATALPADIAAALAPWMALHGEAWNRTDAISLHERTAGFLWAAKSGPAWIVAYSSGGIACCATRLAGFVPAAGGHRQTMSAPEALQDATCHDIDAFVDRSGAAN